MRMVFQLRRKTGERYGSVKRVAEQLDIGVESVRSWVKQADIDAGERGGMTTEESEELTALRSTARAAAQRRALTWFQISARFEPESPAGGLSRPVSAMTRSLPSLAAQVVPPAALGPSTAMITP